MKGETYLRAFEQTVVEALDAYKKSIALAKDDLSDVALANSWRWYCRRTRQARRFRKKLQEFLESRP